MRKYDLIKVQTEETRITILFIVVHDAVESSEDIEAMQPVMYVRHFMIGAIVSREQLLVDQWSGKENDA